MLVSKLLVGVLSAAVTALPSSDGSGITVQGQEKNSRCVNGSPKKYDQWTINYKEVKLSPKGAADGYNLDPTWMAVHETVGDASHYFMGSSWVPWGENECQYSCNARQGCVSFVGYQTQCATPNDGELYCHFFDALIPGEDIIQRPANGAYKITHAYNKLCDDKSAI